MRGERRVKRVSGVEAAAAASRPAAPPAGPATDGHQLLIWLLLAAVAVTPMKFHFCCESDDKRK